MNKSLAQSRMCGEGQVSKVEKENRVKADFIYSHPQS